MIAVQPESGAVFDYLCDKADVDLIVVDATKRLPFVFRKHTVMKAIERGIQFELSYANAFSDTSSRRHFLSNLIALARATGGRHLILSSGTPHSIFLRSPYAVIHMARLAGLSQIQATATISSNPQRLIQRIGRANHR